MKKREIMAYKGVLYIEGVNSGVSDDGFSIVEFETEFTQNTDADGRPDGGVHGGRLLVTIVTPSEANVFREWMFKDYYKMDGVICLVGTGRRNNQVIQFKDAWLVGLYEYFNGNNEDSMVMRLTIQPTKVYFGNGQDSIGINLTEHKSLDSDGGVMGTLKNILSGNYHSQNPFF